MPILPDPSNFPSASKKGDEPTKNRDEGEQRQKASAADHTSKGPQIPDEMPPKASKEEIEARKKELNKAKDLDLEK
ncbi:hypothetical protein N7448_009097 [Penicillium atrosanguineum]|uniref:Uncharacterized protein n=1 Tax=Penicillium atrosanguineum TaxID=1132637 RepID=A0A9W9Q0G0_9EURO|nr:uncharacterized protein N7443_006343 [Penicillium atrosanguineum]KAJ5123000.1 hypothetical protein N7448_009097 [Penicillium atrosanguineum]KAJ5141632.1 hypothetical protein N7526_002627 [Penicillium atrosanguineum]KAJ5298223.1 hypothetical protein N7443_006343 [Penicillium atrosanguineum]KAJ5321511.1 hypothetical protein N7476_004513 [Penicillium atrosanguineum]